MSLSNYRLSHKSKGYGEHYEKTYSHGYYMYQWEELEKPILKEILLKFKNEGKNRSLDFACGTGRILNVNEEFFDDSYGVDISESMMDVARERCEKSEVIQQDITKEPLQGTFDVITSFRFFLNAEEKLREEVLCALRKNLNDSGYLVINVHVNSRSFLGLVYRLRNKLLKKHVANTLGYNEFKKLLNQTGFQIKEDYWYSYWPRIGWRFDGFSKVLLPHVDKVWKLLRLPKMVSQCFILVCVKGK